MISLYFSIPFPEDLPDDVWYEKMRQIEWLSEKGLIGVKYGNNTDDKTN